MSIRELQVDPSEKAVRFDSGEPAFREWLEADLSGKGLSEKPPYQIDNLIFEPSIEGLLRSFSERKKPLMGKPHESAFLMDRIVPSVGGLNCLDFFGCCRSN
jgi:hypothetical protein